MIKLLKAALIYVLLAAPSSCSSFQQPSTHAYSHHAKTQHISQSRTVSRVNSLDTANYNSFHRLSKDATTGAAASTTSLEAASVLAAASSPAGAFLVLTSIIVVHEAGHYLAARSYGMKVEEFAIGFGPKLFGFEALGNEFNFRAFPLGGYVRFPENYNITDYQQQQREMREKIQEQRNKTGLMVENKPNALGYQVANFVTLGAMERKRIKDEEDALAKAQASQQEQNAKNPWWKSVFGGNKKNKDGPQSPLLSARRDDLMDPDDIPIEYYDDPDLLQNRPWFERAVVLSGGVVFNLLLAFGIYFGEITTSGLPQPVFEQGILVSQNPAREAAANGVLRRGDVIVGINGNALALSQSPTAAASQEAITNLISTIRATPDGDDVKLSIIRSKGAKPVDLSIKPTRVQANAPKTVGVMLSPNYVKTELLKVSNPVQAVVPAAKLVSSTTRDTAGGLLKFFGQLVSGKDTGGQQVSGPIGLLKTGSDIVSTKDWSTVFAFAAAISINLGVVNAFPLPALDGGQLVFVLAEAVTRKKIDQRLQEEIIGVTVLLLLFVSVSAALGDVQSLLVKK